MVLRPNPLCCKLAELVREQQAEIAAAVAFGDPKRIYNLGGYHQAQRAALNSEIQNFWAAELGRVFAVKSGSGEGGGT